MRRPTLANFISSGGSLIVGICGGDISEAAALANLAEERLIIDPMAPDEGWVGGSARMVFNVVPSNLSSYIVTPRNVARVILLDVCKTPIRLRNGFFEYLEFGAGLQPKNCGTQACAPSVMQAYERDSVFTLNDFASVPQHIRIFPTDQADLGRRIVLQGPDQNGATIYGTDNTTQAASLGETVYMSLPFVTALNTFSGITGIQKDPTLGPVQVFMVDPTTGAQTLLTTLEPNETTALYRRYFINGLPCNCCNTPAGRVQVSAQVKLDFIPLVNPSDYLNIPNIPALIEEVQAIRYSRMDSTKAAQLEAKHHLKALQLLNGQLDHIDGKISTAVSVSIFGSDKLRAQPV